MKWSGLQLTTTFLVSMSWEFESIVISHIILLFRLRSYFFRIHKITTRIARAAADFTESEPLCGVLNRASNNYCSITQNESNLFNKVHEIHETTARYVSRVSAYDDFDRFNFILRHGTYTHTQFSLTHIIFFRSRQLCSTQWEKHSNGRKKKA